MIPKVIHWCWLSGEPYPTEVKRCMDSWRKVLKGYEFKLWDMHAVKAIGAPWMDAAIKERKWAFAADYIRIWVLYHEGGIYLDTDVEVLMDMSPLLDRDVLMGEESGTGMLEAAVMGAAPGSHVMGKVLDSFEDSPTGETLPERMKRIVGDEVVLLDSDVLSPKNWRTGKINITKRTYTIHHFAGSWLSSKEKWAARMGRLLGPWAVPCTRWIFSRFGK